MENEMREEYFIKEAQMKDFHEMQRLGILKKKDAVNFVVITLKLNI